MFYLVCTRRPCLCAHCLRCADRAPSRHLARAAIHGLRVPPETHLALEGVCLRRPRAPHRPLRRKEIGTCYGDFGHITCIKDPEIVSVGKAYLFLLSSLFIFHSSSVHHLFTTYSPPCFLHRHLCYWCCATCSSKAPRTASQILPLLADAVFTLKYKALVFLPYVDEVLDAQVESVESDRVKVRAWPQEIKISKKVCCLLALALALALLFPLPPLGNSLARCTLTPRTRSSLAPAPSARRPSKTPSSCTTRRTKSGRATRRPSSAAAASA